MNMLITPEEVIRLSFRESEYLRSTTVLEADIVAATDRFITPIIGQTMVEQLSLGDYRELMSDYIAPALAASVRLLIQPLLNIRTEEAGATSPRTDSTQQAPQSAMLALHNSLKQRARQLLKRVSDHLNKNADKYPEYDPKSNILNRCSINGGFVQTF